MNKVVNKVGIAKNRLVRMSNWRLENFDDVNIELKDCKIVSMLTDYRFEKGFCDTCDYGSEYVSTIGIIVEQEGNIFILFGENKSKCDENVFSVGELIQIFLELVYKKQSLEDLVCSLERLGVCIKKEEIRV